MDPRFQSLGLVVRERAGGARVVASRFGGHVLSWVASGRERLYLSSSAIADARQPVRGGVPVCFPQFSGRGTLPKHGFARTRVWAELPSAPDAIHLRLAEDAASLALWPHRFTLDLHVALEADALAIRLDVRNTDARPWSFTGALHTYLRVDDVAAMRLAGLEGGEVEDTLLGTLGPAPAPDLARPIDSVYHDVAGPLALRGPGTGLRIAQDGFPDAVVWNPGADGAAQMADIGPGEARQFLCVEAAQARAPRTLQPGEAWSGTQHLRVLSG